MSISRTVSARFETQLNTPPETSACQKLVIIMSLGIFIALASLIASLPLELRSHFESQEPSTTDDFQGDHGSNMWMIVATIFGMLAGPAVAYLFVNLYNRTSPVLIHAGILIASVITFLWVLFTYSLVWGKDAWDDQILGFPGTYYMFRHTGSNVETDLSGTPASIFAVFELAFPIVSALIVASGIIDRVNVYGLLTFIIVWHICIWCPIAHIVWNKDGFFMQNQIIDFSGGIVVNMLSGVTILVLNLYLDWKQAPKHEANGVKDSEGLLVQALGLWFVNFALNAGKAHAANAIACQSIVNTIAGVMTSILLNFFWDQVFDVPYTVVAITNAILIGLVSTTPSSGYVTVGGAMVVSAFTVLSTRIVAKWILKDGLNDKPYSALTIYGVAGTIGFLWTALMAYKFVNPMGQNGLTYGWQTPIRHHTAAILAIWFCTIIPLFIAVFLVDLFVPLSRAEQPKGDFAPTNIGPFRAESVSLNTDGIYKQNSGVQGANDTAAAEQQA